MIKSLVEIDLEVLKASENKPLLKGVKFSIPKGRITLFKGQNGLGKSQLIYNILELKHNYKGNIKRDFPKNDFSFLPQVENVELKIPLQLKEICAQEMSFFSHTLMGNYWNKSSGGERKRALLARCLSKDQSLYVLDEPLNHLDKDSQKLVAQELMSLCDLGKTVIMTGHIDSVVEPAYLNTVELEQWKC